MTANAAGPLSASAEASISQAAQTTEVAETMQTNGEAAAGDSLGNEAQETPEASSEAETRADDAKDEDEKNTKPEDQTMKAEIKHLDKKTDDDGNKIYIERKIKEDAEKRDWWNLYALCEVRHFWDDGDYKCTRLHVNSQPLKQLLQDVIGDFPDEPLDAATDMEIDTPTYCLFFYRRELETEGMQRFAEDEEARSHLKVLLEHIDNSMEDSIRAHKRAMASESKAISYEHLWTLFKPGTTLFAYLLGQPRAFKLDRFSYDEDERNPAFTMDVEFVDYDGETFGTRETELRIPKYSGSMRGDLLNVKPLDLLPQELEIRRQLIARGRRFEGLTGQHYVQHSGVAVKRKIQGCGYDRFNVTGRVMIDCKTYHRLDPNDAFGVSEIARSEAAKRQREIRKQNDGAGDDPAGKKANDELLDEDRLLCNATVRGYSFTHKRFLEFFIGNISEIEWNTKCFQQLVLDPAPKRTIQALVSTHARRSTQDAEAFDDIVKGKGQGLVMVLHGPPGVGKTLTAECVAEWVRRPLYMVSSGDLGVDPTTLDDQLTSIMDMTSTWNAVLLIDEADVFLEARGPRDMQRNGMVSVFLRVLEYYSGILFLTTNRVATFDDAFKSRIHVPLRYRDLTHESRRSIWKNFLDRVPGGADVTDEDLVELAKINLNGRQIKNVVKTAESLAAFEGAKLDYEQIQEVTRIQAKFEEDLLEAAEAGAEGV